MSAGRPAGSSCLPSWSSVVADVRREALREVGIPDPVAVPGSGVLPADRHVPGMPPFRVPGRFQCSTLVVSPGYMPERLQLTWNVPSEARDIERLVARHLPHNCYPFASHVLAAHPQPSADFAAFLAIPEWITYAGLSGVVLDLRAATLQQDGPIIGTYLSRPTSLAEIEREAGFYSMGAFTVLVGASMVPLRRDEQVFLENGSLVRLIRAEFPLDRCASLTDLLESDDFSHFQGPFPHVPEPRALMILHRSGRFLFGAGRSAGQPIHTAIVNFVGVPEGSVTFHSPSDGCAERITHRGSNVRGVLVLADRLLPRDQSIVIFLDLRPVAAGLSYLCLAHPRLGYDDLEGLLPRLIPAGWRLTVLGGRRRTEHLEVSHRDTLVLGLVSVLDPVDVAPPLGRAPAGRRMVRRRAPPRTAPKAAPDPGAALVSAGVQTACPLPRTARFMGLSGMSQRAVSPCMRARLPAFWLAGPGALPPRVIFRVFGVVSVHWMARLLCALRGQLSLISVL